jgi:hypothetical protein
MVAPELTSQSEKYEYCEPFAFIHLETGIIPKHYRLAMIIDKIWLFEPIQDGVLRYPPVQVDVPRNPDSIDDYVNMGPTNWSEAFGKIQPDTEQALTET